MFARILVVIASLFLVGAYPGDNPRYRSTILDDRDGLNVTAPPSSTVRIFNRNGKQIIQDSSGKESEIDVGNTVAFNIVGNETFDGGVSGWSGTPSPTSETGASNVARGYSLKWDSTASAQALVSTAQTVPNALKGRACVVAINYKYEGGAAAANDYDVSVYDGTNDLIAQQNLPLSNGKFVNAAYGFVCPTSGTIQIRLTSNVPNADPIYIDDVWLGSDYRRGVVGDSAELIAATNASCAGNWNRTSNALGQFSTATSCAAGTADVTSLLTVNGPTGTDRPNNQVVSVPPGRYLVQYIFSASVNATGSDLYLGVSDDGCSTVKGRITTAQTTSNYLTEYVVQAAYTYTTTANRSWEVCGAATNPNTISISSVGADRPLHFKLYRFPTQSPRDTVTLETQGWFIDASIRSTTSNGVSLGLTTDGSFGVPTDSNMTMTLNSGSQTAQIPCDTGTASSGLTCSAAAEGLGVVFQAPRQGRYRICNTFSHLVRVQSVSSYGYSTFKLSTTGNTNFTIAEAGDVAILSGQDHTAAVDIDTTSVVHFCEYFVLNPGQATIRLFEKTTVAGSGPVTNRIDNNFGLADGNGYHISVTLETENFPQAVALTSIASAVGVDGTSAAPTGYVGEEIVHCGTGIAIGTSSTQLRTISLTAGDWDISGAGHYSGAVNSFLALCISTASASCTLGLNGVQRGLNEFNCFINSGTGTGSCFVPQYRVLVTSTTPYYLNGSISGTPDSGFNGCIRARRRR